MPQLVYILYSEYYILVQYRSEEDHEIDHRYICFKFYYSLLKPS
jgi:hypothetical protein